MSPVIHTHVVERLDSTNKQNAHTRVHMYTTWKVWLQVYTVVLTTPWAVPRVYSCLRRHINLLSH